MFSWYQKKFAEQKPEGRNLEDTNFLEQSENLEERLRNLSPEQKEKLRQQRLRIAEEFINEAKRRVRIVSWAVSGSTVGEGKNFGFCSDLDLEILTNPRDEKQKRFEGTYLYEYLTWKYAEENGVLVDCLESTVKDLKLLTTDPKIRNFFERLFGIKFEDIEQKC